MSKKSRSLKERTGESARPSTLAAPSKVVDPALEALFSSSAAIVAKKSSGSLILTLESLQTDPKTTDSSSEKGDPAKSEISSGISGSLEDDIDDVAHDSSELFLVEEEQTVSKNGLQPSTSRKRKRKDDEDNIEGLYMQRLAREEEHESARQFKDRTEKRRKLHETEHLDPETASESNQSDNHDEDTHLQHEILTPNSAIDLEKSSRTIFLSNVSTTAITSKPAHRTLLTHLSSHLSSLPPPKPPSTAHKLLTLRFRSTPLSPSVPKRAAITSKSLMPSTTRSTNAYAVYSTAIAAREAVKRLNGSVVLDRHLRVDGVAHPGVVDHRRCVFVGNLGFVDDESAIRKAEERDGEKAKKRKEKEPADVEEGLWRVFGKAGTVENVRVVRDSATRVGKGFAYVQFKDPNAVERALLYNNRKFPPMLPRLLRVTRAKAVTKTASHQKSASFRPNARPVPKGTGHYKAKPSSEALSLAGRAGKLLGKAGAARLRRGDVDPAVKGGAKVGIKTPEKVVFEGHRASRGQGRSGLGKKGKGKPTTRSSRRGAAFKAKGGKKG